jgi:hypothetical protein
MTTFAEIYGQINNDAENAFLEFSGDVAEARAAFLRLSAYRIVPPNSTTITPTNPPANLPSPGSVQFTGGPLAPRTVADAPVLSDVPSIVLGQMPATPSAPPELSEAQYRGAFDDIQPVLLNTLNGQCRAWLDTYFSQHAAGLAAVEEKLAKYLAGGTAIPADIEAQIIERNRDRTIAEYLRTRDQVYGEAALRGFTIPGGAVNGALLRARQAGMDNIARASVEVAVKNMELEQANIQFAVTNSINLRQLAVNAVLQFGSLIVQTDGQAEQWAQGFIEQVARLYTLKAEYFKLQLEGLKLQTDVQVEQVRAQLQRNEGLLRQYETQIRATIALMESDRAIFDGQIKVFEVGAEQIRLNQQLLIENQRSQLAVYETTNKVKLAAFEANLTVGLKTAELAVEQLKAVGTLAAQTAKSAADYAASVRTSVNALFKSSEE